jgi:hypothetical protein
LGNAILGKVNCGSLRGIRVKPIDDRARVEETFLIHINADLIGRALQYKSGDAMIKAMNGHISAHAIPLTRQTLIRKFKGDGECWTRGPWSAGGKRETGC